MTPGNRSAHRFPSTIMMPASFIWKPIVQKVVTGRWKRFRMRPGCPSLPAADLKRVGLYVHVPFCKNLCPFCPYNRIEYDEALFAAYERAIHAEIDLYTPSLAGCEIISLYIGGGTPTVNTPGLLRIINHIRTNFALSCDICVELHPAAMDDACLQELQQAGVTMLSVGVESTDDAILQRIGRNHDGSAAVASLRRAVAMGFKAVNADLMFALPGQSLKDWEKDLRTVIGEGIDQISTYPLFSFPYSDLGQSRQIRTVKRPAGTTVRAMLRLTDTLAANAGYHRCAVWSWLKPGKKKFSSITRHHYIGFGPSAASMTGTDFYVNTFDVAAYAASLPSRRPIALSMPVDIRLEMAYWLYWRAYDLNIFERDFSGLFGDGYSLDSCFATILKPFCRAGMLMKTSEGYRITESGAYWIHRLQNEYSLNYINRLWGTCRKTPWPTEVCL